MVDLYAEGTGFKPQQRQYHFYVKHRHHYHLTTSFFFKFQTTKVFLDHIESRKSHKAGAIFDVLIQFVCSRQKVTSLMNAIRQNPSVEEVTVIGDKDADIQGHLALVLITVVPSVVVECQFS